MSEMQKHQASYRRIMTSDHTSPAIELAKQVHLKAIMIRDEFTETTHSPEGRPIISDWDCHPLLKPYKEFHDYLMMIADEIENLPIEKQKLPQGRNVFR